MKLSSWITFLPLIMRWQQILQDEELRKIVQLLRKSHWHPTVYASWFESICIPNYWLLIVTNDNEAGSIKGSLNRRYRDRWDVFESPGGLQPILSFSVFSSLRSLSTASKCGTTLLRIKTNVRNINRKFLHSRTGTTHRIRSAVSENSIFANLLETIAAANFNRRV